MDRLLIYYTSCVWRVLRVTWEFEHGLITYKTSCHHQCHLNLDVSCMMLGNFAFFFFFFEASPDIMLHRLEMETDVSKYILHIPNVLLYPWIKIIWYVRMKISIITDILVLWFIGYIEDISMNILKKISINLKLIRIYKNIRKTS